MNFIFDALEENPAIKIEVFTTKNTTSFKTPNFPNTKIYRFGTISQNPVERYASYLWFNLITSIMLLVNRVDKIMVFETLSIFPLWVISIIYKNNNGHIHFHEYVSDPERIGSSVYMKILFYLEDQLLKKYSCSQTNEDRKKLLLIDKPFLKSELVEIRPNIPPKYWWNKYGQFKIKSTAAKIKLVYIGACDKQTMYVKELFDWVKANSHQLELTIISQQIDDQTIGLIASYNTSAIKLLEPIDYYELPKELVKYDVGLVLYKGHIPNFLYNVPNKVHEYLSCGLKVIVNQDLISTVKLGIEQILAVDFTSLDSLTVRLLLSLIDKSDC
jgi:hypothetical protein